MHFWADLAQKPAAAAAAAAAASKQQAAKGQAAAVHSRQAQCMFSACSASSKQQCSKQAVSSMQCSMQCRLTAACSAACSMQQHTVQHAVQHAAQLQCMFSACSVCHSYSSASSKQQDSACSFATQAWRPWPPAVDGQSALRSQAASAACARGWLPAPACPASAWGSLGRPGQAPAAVGGSGPLAVGKAGCAVPALAQSAAHLRLHRPVPAAVPRQAAQ